MTSDAAREPVAEPQLVRCKNFGCKKFFDPAHVENTVCVHHRSPPVFHETVKYWACCPHRKAYDWEEFMTIPGCQRGHCSAQESGKKFLGGVDVRAENTPKQIVEGAPADPKQKLEKLRLALLGLGLATGDFDKAWGRLAAKHGDLDAPVVADIRMACTEVLERLDLETDGTV